MNDTLSFNITKLGEVVEKLQESFDHYEESLNSLEEEIKKLDTVWGNSEFSTWTVFKEKYDEKKSKLLEAEAMLKVLLNQLSSKKEQIQNATIKARNSFE